MKRCGALVLPMAAFAGIGTASAQAVDSLGRAGSGWYGRSGEKIRRAPLPCAVSVLRDAGALPLPGFRLCVFAPASVWMIASKYGGQRYRRKGLAQLVGHSEHSRFQAD